MQPVLVYTYIASQRQSRRSRNQRNVTRSTDLTFTLSAKGRVAPRTWMDHPAKTIGVFIDNVTGVPSNGFYLVPGIPRTREWPVLLVDVED
jgi:hypothetical protein